MSARDRAILWCFLACAAAVYLVILYCMLVVASREDDRMEDEYAKLIVPETTQVPAPETTPKLTVTYPVPLEQELQDYIVETCLKYEVSPAIVFAVIGVESGYDAGKVGDNGNSFGLMQIYASQHTQRCIRLNTYNLLDPRQNVLTGVDYLAELLATGHDIEWCLSWYNGHGGDSCEYARTVMCNAEQILEGVRVSE